MKFNEHLINLRKKTGFSQETLAEKLGVARQTISKWELGDTTPDMDNLIKLSSIFNVSIDELVGNIKEKEKNQNNHCVSSKNSIFKKILLVFILLLFILLIIFFIKRYLIVKELFSYLENTQYDSYSIISTNTKESINEETGEKENLTTKGNIEFLDGEGLSATKKFFNGTIIIDSLFYENANTQTVYHIIKNSNTKPNEAQKLKYINYKDYLTNNFLTDSIIYSMYGMGYNKSNLIFNFSIKITKTKEDTIILEKNSKTHSTFVAFDLLYNQGNIVFKETDNINQLTNTITYLYKEITDENYKIKFNIDASEFKIVNVEDKEEGSSLNPCLNITL